MVPLSMLSTQTVVRPGDFNGDRQDGTLGGRAEQFSARRRGLAQNISTSRAGWLKPMTLYTFGGIVVAFALASVLSNI
jgi:hypothetical protein